MRTAILSEMEDPRVAPKAVREMDGARRSRAAAAACWLSRLSIANFRCYAAADLELDRRPVVLAGPNGAGKTNLLEAISFLSPGRGLRGARLSEIDRRAGAGGVPSDALQAGDVPPGASWSVAARIVTPDGPRDLGTGRDAEVPTGGQTGSETGSETGGARERRLVKIDGAFARGQQGLGEVLRVVWLTPRMDGLFRDSPGGRRKFLDRLVTGFDSGHTGRVAAYEQALRQRVRLLKAGPGDQAWLAALEDTMARHGIAIAAARRAFAEALSRSCAEAAGPFPRARIAVEGEVDGWLARGPALQAEDELRVRLAAARRQDAETGGAAAGPHRSDLAVTDLAGGRPAAEGSTGEQKALLLSIVLSHARLLAAEWGSAPVVLLDEVAAHLDPRRRAALFEEILDLGAQAWLTGTEAALFAALGDAAQNFAVDKARLVAQQA